MPAPCFLQIEPIIIWFNLLYFLAGWRGEPAGDGVVVALRGPGGAARLCGAPATGLPPGRAVTAAEAGRGPAAAHPGCCHDLARTAGAFTSLALSCALLMTDVWQCQWSSCLCCITQEPSRVPENLHSGFGLAFCKAGVLHVSCGR